MIELVPGKAPMSKTPYRVSTPEMIELKMQLQELWEKKYVRPSVFYLRKRKMIHSGGVLVIGS